MVALLNLDVGSLISPSLTLPERVPALCEFSVFLNKEIVCRDVVYAKIEGNGVLLKDVLGSGKTFKDCKIVEVDVSSERLVLASK